MVCPSDYSPLEENKECRVALSGKCDVTARQGFLFASVKRCCRDGRAHMQILKILIIKTNKQTAFGFVQAALFRSNRQLVTTSRPSKQLSRVGRADQQLFLTLISVWFLNINLYLLSICNY